MPTDTIAPRSRSAAGRGLLVVGWMAVLLPAIYMMSVGWDSGEHGGTVILLGLFATAFQLVVWGFVWHATPNRSAAARRLVFGSGAASSLVASLGVLALTGRPVWAGLTYLAIASLTVAMVALAQRTQTSSRVSGRS